MREKRVKHGRTKSSVDRLNIRVAADIGGTFTDIAFFDVHGNVVVKKVLSSPEDYSRAVVSGIVELIAENGISHETIGDVIHGCTIATNALVERKGAKTALITTKGFRDVLELRRIRVPNLYDAMYVKPDPLVPRYLRFEVDERLDANGAVLTDLSTTEIAYAVKFIRDKNVEAIAICFLHSYVNPSHERALGETLRAEFPSCYISLSSEILPEIREYERTSTTVINSYVGPVVSSYLSALSESLKKAGFHGRLQVMQSNGGTISSDAVTIAPAQIIECGPAAGVVGSAKLAAQSDLDNLITFDMGGTTAKASLIENGTVSMTDEYEVGADIAISSRLVKGNGFALKMPVIDISEIGTGGGSIVWIDRAGHVKVGPQSAGAVPGPCCYGLGGESVTVTDANVVLGYLNQLALAGGTVPIDADRAFAAVSEQIAKPTGMSVSEAAFAIHEIANLTMMGAIKVVSTHRGRDPREFSLFAFGGNGGVHGPSLARSLQIEKVIVPPAAGVFSAIGLLLSDIRLSQSKSFNCRTEELDTSLMEKTYGELEAKAAQRLESDVSDIQFERLADVRYVGQAFELPIMVPKGIPPEEVAIHLEREFEKEHEKTYGHVPGGAKQYQIVKVSIVAVKTSRDAHVLRPTTYATNCSQTADNEQFRKAYFGPNHGELDTAIITRNSLADGPRNGPIVIEEYEGTVVVPPQARAVLDSFGNITVTFEAADI